MPIIKSAIKRVKVSERQAKENRGPKSALATAIKKFNALLAENKIDEAEKLFPETVAIIDCSAKKGIITKDNANRKKSQFAKKLNNAKLAK